MVYYPMTPWTGLTEWENIKGKPYIVVSAKGIANGLSDIPNDGADFGPDTTLGATSPNQIGPPYTQTSGIQEAAEYSFKKYGYTHFKLTEGVYNIYATIYLHSEKEVFIEGFEGTNQNVMSTIQQNSPVPVFQNYGNESSINTHVFRNFATFLNIGTSTTKVFNFVNTTGGNILSLYLIHIRFNTKNTGTTGNYSVYNDGAFYRIFHDGTGLGNANNFTLYTVANNPYPSALWVFGGGYIGDIVASMRHVYISNTNWYGNLTLTNTGTQPLNVDIHDLKYQPQTTASQTAMVTVNTSIDNINIHDVHYIVYQNLSEIVQLAGTSSSPITVGKLSIRNFRFTYWPLASGTYTIGPPFTTSYASVVDYDIEPIIPNSSKIIMSPAFTSTTSGTTAGTVNMRFTEYASYYKKMIITFTGYENNTANNQTVNFPQPFTTYAVITGNNTGLTISASTTGITITSPNSTTTYSGIVIVEGY